MKTVHIMRGISGSGKSTKAKKLAANISHVFDVRVVSADHFWDKFENGEFNIKQLSTAHNWCQSMFVKACKEGVDIIIVDNTNTTLVECEFYVWVGRMFGYDIREKRVDPEHAMLTDRDGDVNLENEPSVLSCALRNKHNVPVSKVFQQWERFEKWSKMHWDSTYEIYIEGREWK